MSDPLFTAAKLLESHGYAVVELPKPVGVNGTDNTVWLSDPYIEQEFNGDITISDRLGIDAGHTRDDHWRGFDVPKACAHLYNRDQPDEIADLCMCKRFHSLWDDAVDFDRRIRKGGASANPLDGEAFLHRSRVPLDLAPIDRVTRAEYAEMQLDLFEDGDPDGCSPYGCRSGEVA